MSFRFALMLLALFGISHAYEYQGKRMLYRSEFAQNFVGTDGSVLEDGTWICRDSLEGYYVFSTDTGRTWAKVPAAPQGHTPLLVGDDLVAYLLSKRWDVKTGWANMSMPASWSAEGLYYAYMWSNGVWAKRSYASSTEAQFYRSTDGAHTFSEWFRIPLASLPGNSLDGLSFLKKVWFPVSDSGYMRGTDDGVNWSRLIMPKSFVPKWSLELDSGAVISVVGRSGDSLWYAHSQDSGKTWKESDASVPGGYYVEMKGEYSFSGTVDDQGVETYWITRKGANQWEKLDGARGIFFIGNEPYALLPTQTAHIVNVGSIGIVENNRGLNRLMRVRTASSGFEVHFDESLVGKRWKVIGTDGALRAQGDITSCVVNIRVSHGVNWLIVGGSAILLPLQGL